MSGAPHISSAFVGVAIVGYFASAIGFAEPADQPAVMLAYLQCIDSNAATFARGPDSADLVADAVIQKCEPVLTNAVSRIVPPGTGAAVRLQVLDSIRKPAAKRALMVVVETRATFATR